jgi:hypothetical protein
VPRLSSLLRGIFACSVLLTAVDSASAQARPRTQPAANPAQFVAKFRTHYTDVWNQFAAEYDEADKKDGTKTEAFGPADKKDGAKQKYIGYKEAFKVFGLTKPEVVWTPEEAERREAEKEKKEEEKKAAESTSTASTSTSTSETKPKKKARKKPDRVDIHFVDALDKDGDGKISKKEYDDWADSSAKADAAAYATQLNALRAAGQSEAQLAKAEAAALKQAQANQKNALNAFVNAMKQQQVARKK